MHEWLLILAAPYRVWRCADWPRCSAMRFGREYATSL